MIIRLVLLAIVDACVWAGVVLLFGASAGRALLAFMLVFLLSLFVMCLFAGAGLARERSAYYLGEK